jgi:hypothetical protein
LSFATYDLMQIFPYLIIHVCYSATVEYNIHIPLTNRSVLGESPAVCGLEITEFALQTKKQILVTIPVQCIIFRSTVEDLDQDP